MLENKEQSSTTMEAPTSAVKIALFIWMVAIFIFHLLMFSPPFVLNLAAHFGFLESLNRVHDDILPFFQTSDFSADVDFR
jgi:hypothetical protein